MAVSMDDLKAVADAARDLAYRQLDSQIQASNNFDAKALGLLAFDGAALAAILAAPALFSGHWEIPALVLGISAVFAIFAMRKSDWDEGPDARDFYDHATQGGVMAGSAAKASVELVSELGGPHGSISRNEQILRRKAWFFGLGLGATVIAGILGAILVAIH